MYESGKIPVTANGALAAHIRVKPTAGTTTDPIQVEAAGAGEQHIGVTEFAIADGVVGTIRAANDSGTVEVTAAGAFSRGADLYGAASGKVDDTVAGRSLGVALDAATADGDVIEMLPQPNKTTRGFINLPLALWREVSSNDIPAAAADAGVLGKDSTPNLEFANGDTDSHLRLDWAASNSDPIVHQVALPPDFDPSQNLEFHIRAAMAGATDTPDLDLDIYFNEGDTKVSDAVSAITGIAYAEYTGTIAAADIPAGAQTVTIELTPGAHTTDVLYASATWLEFGTVDV